MADPGTKKYRCGYNVHHKISQLPLISLLHVKQQFTVYPATAGDLFVIFASGFGRRRGIRSLRITETEQDQSEEMTMDTTRCKEIYLERSIVQSVRYVTYRWLNAIHGIGIVWCK